MSKENNVPRWMRVQAEQSAKAAAGSKPFLQKGLSDEVIFEQTRFENERSEIPLRFETMTSHQVHIYSWLEEESVPEDDLRERIRAASKGSCGDE